MSFNASAGFDYAYLLAAQTRGGIMVAWNASMWSASGISTKPFSVSARMRHYSGGDKWWLTCVYRPPREGEKDVFVAELHKLRTIRTGPWLLTGDFNMIYIVEDKNNVQLNRRLMGHFYHFLNDVSLKEIHTKVVSSRGVMSGCTPPLK
jgi:hypothetical protein